MSRLCEWEDNSGWLPIPKYRGKDKESMKKNGKKWQEWRAENKCNGMFQYPRKKDFQEESWAVYKTQKCLIEQMLVPQFLSVYVARLPTARTCISLILDFLWLPEPALSWDLGGWKCQGIKAPHSPSSNPQPMIERRWCVSTPAPLPLEWHHWDACSTPFPRVPQQD